MCLATIIYSMAGGWECWGGTSYDQGYGSIAIESRSGEYYDIENGDVNAPSEGPDSYGAKAIEKYCTDTFNQVILKVFDELEKNTG